MANTPPALKLTSYEYNTLKTSTEKKIKPPAVPPKTYLESNTDTQDEIETPNDEEAQSNDGDVDTCSVGSDSLYDMKLEKFDFQMPKRVALISATTNYSTGAVVIQGDDKVPPRNVPRIPSISTDSKNLRKQNQLMPEQIVSAASDHEPAQAEISAERDKIPPRNVPRIRTTSTDSKKSLKLTKHELQVHYEGKHMSDSNESGNYQKLDTKKLAPPNRYDDLDNLPSKPQKDKAMSKNQQHAASTGQESHYEPLRLKSMDKESAYQELKSVHR